MKLSKIIKRFRIDHPHKFRLADIDPGDTCGLDIDKVEAKAIIAKSIQQLARRQDVLYAHNRWAVLAIFQAMDAAGKDSAIKHVMSGVNPQACQVFSFKAPSHEELDHDFLWRTNVRLPERGPIGIFNRSYYEEVLVVRAHRELLERQKLPDEVVGKNIWEWRFQSINALEQHLARNGVTQVGACDLILGRALVFASRRRIHRGPVQLVPHTNKRVCPRVPVFAKWSAANAAQKCRDKPYATSNSSQERPNIKSASIR
jgi:Polyphosphate kinase 2 (PPK2)